MNLHFFQLSLIKQEYIENQVLYLDKLWLKIGDYCKLLILVEAEVNPSMISLSTCPHFFISYRIQTTRHK